LPGQATTWLREARNHSEHGLTREQPAEHRYSVAQPTSVQRKCQHVYSH
jgi:hypothetical protein